jgi:hypothetical protein
MNRIDLPSGCTIAEPDARLAAFCSAEYIYYDAIVSPEPNKIEPIDVLVTVAVNSYVDRAAKVVSRPSRDTFRVRAASAGDPRGRGSARSRELARRRP